MLEQLKKEVYEANMMLVKYNLVLFTWGNVSGVDRERGLVVIKPSGVEYDKLSPLDLPVLDLDGNVVEGHYNPPPTRRLTLNCTRRFPTSAALRIRTRPMPLPLPRPAAKSSPMERPTPTISTGTIPCTRKMAPREIEEAYEKNTGLVIAETFAGLDPDRMPAVLVHSHAPFTWGKNAGKSVEASVILEQVAQMAQYTELLQLVDGIKGGVRMQNDLLRKHFDRKHGPGAYYGQGGEH